MPIPMNLNNLMTALNFLRDRHGSALPVYIKQSEEVNADYYPPDVLAIQGVEITKILVHPEDTEMSTCILITGEFDA